MLGELVAQPAYQRLKTTVAPATNPTKAAAICKLGSGSRPPSCRNQTITGASKKDNPEWLVFRKPEASTSIQ